MKRSVSLIVLVLIIAGAGTVLAEPPAEELGYLWSLDPGNGGDNFYFIPLLTLAAAASTDAPVQVPGSIRNNQYFLESLRLTRLAQDSFAEGDYDTSTQYAALAVEQARLSDEYVARQLKVKETDDAIMAAHSRISWAQLVEVPSRYPRQYEEAHTAYDNALVQRDEESWDDAISSAKQVLAALAGLAEPAAEPAAEPGEAAPLPAQYTVRPWALTRDCLWNIAGRDWAYGDSRQWQLLYEANRLRLPDPNNPDLIHPGFVLEIPSIRGEARTGMWEDGVTYVPLD
ncbi:MAG: LysM peptidoglycan-binding domain-containing protein [Treponema sp.]|jgi:hypothetical protein|nr:LysM peptidoglycan-binding domain-containing protein [Treponema sp.]